MLFLLVLFSSACGSPAEGKTGADLFEVTCARCHLSDGSGLVGPPIGTADSNAALHLTDVQIRAVIRIGPGAMPAFTNLTDEQISSLVEHLRNLQQGG